MRRCNGAFNEVKRKHFRNKYFAMKLPKVSAKLFTFSGMAAIKGNSIFIFWVCALPGRSSTGLK